MHADVRAQKGWLSYAQLSAQPSDRLIDVQKWKDERLTTGVAPAPFLTSMNLATFSCVE